MVRARDRAVELHLALRGNIYNAVVEKHADDLQHIAGHNS